MGAWKVATTITQLGKVAEMLGVTLPASAATGAKSIAASMASAMAPVAELLGMMALIPKADDQLKKHTNLPPRHG